MSVALYKLTGAYLRLMELATDDEDEDGVPVGFSQPFMETLEELEGDIDDKLEGCCKALKSMGALKDAIDSERQLLSRRAQRLDAAIDELKSYVKYNMEQMGFKKRQAGIFKLSICNNSQPSVNVMDIDQVPHSFDKMREREVNLIAIREAHKMGVDVPGVEVVRGTHVRVS